MIKNISHDLENLANKEKARILQRFFKTGLGGYGEGDVFLGIVVPEQRKIANKYKDLDFSGIEELLNSKIHEFRLTALLILVSKVEKSSDKEQQQIVNFYLKHLKQINNWDLVDLSAPKVLGPYFFKRDKKKLYQLVRSQSLWKRRISVLSTYWFIKNNQFSDALEMSEILLKDPEDLIQKAVGWMLREIGKRDKKIEVQFLNRHYQQMPRVMLRYAIEKFSEAERLKFLKKG